MSRTYRRLKGDHTRGPQRGRGWWRHCGELGCVECEKNLLREIIRYHSDAGRTMNSTPSWWVREFMTVPQRAQVRQLIHKVMKLKDLEETPLFPLAKKPHDYYW